MRKLTIIVLALMCAACSMARRVHDVFGFPSAEPGYALGVSACYAGCIGDWIVMAGGCNFATPGHKTYYAGIYAARADSDVLNWRLVGFLPEPAAYGATVASGDSLLLVGGNNSSHALSTVYSLHLDGAGSKAAVRRLADMSCAVDNMAVATTAGCVYVVGGNHDGRPSADILCRSLATPGPWRKAATMPGAPRVQPVSAASGGKLYVWGGFFADADNSIVHTDGCCLDVASGQWTSLGAPLSASGDDMTLSGGIAWTTGDTIFAAGGVDKQIFLDAISGRYECVDKAEYLNQPIEWYRFNGNLCMFDTVAGRWIRSGVKSQGLARAGAQAVPTPLGVYYIGGELKPAVRTPKVVVLTEK